MSCVLLPQVDQFTRHFRFNDLLRACVVQVGLAPWEFLQTNIALAGAPVRFYAQRWARKSQAFYPSPWWKTSSCSGMGIHITRHVGLSWTRRGCAILKPCCGKWPAGFRLRLERWEPSTHREEVTKLTAWRACIAGSSTWLQEERDSKGWSKNKLCFCLKRFHFVHSPSTFLVIV